jgi:cysteine desulfurase
MDKIALDAHHPIGELYDKALLAAYEKSESALCEALGDEGERRVYFCASGSEAVHSALFSYYFQHARQTGQTHIMAPRIESAPFLLSLKQLEEWGCSGKLLPVNAQGQLTRENLLKGINPRTGLLSLSWAQPLTGVIHPIAEIAEVCQEKKIRLHVDGSFILGKLYFNLSDLPIDYFSIHAPQGAAALLLRKTESHAPFIVGAQRAPLESLSALAHMVQETARGCDQMCLEVARLRDKLQRGVKNAVKEAVVFFEEAERLPNCTAIGFSGLCAEALLCLLQRFGVYATIGGGVHQRLSEVLIASGVDLPLAESALSFSLSLQTTQEEIDAAIEAIAVCVHNLRRSS